ncbi:MAG: sce7725 family protein [Victivallaceae bacterium]
MYWPYFRGKQFELLAIRDATSVVSRERICPIIEPVRANTKSLEVACDALLENGFSFSLILNPCCGDFRGRNSRLYQLAERYRGYLACRYGFIISDGTTIEDLLQFFEFSSGHAISLIHYSDHLDRAELIKILSEQQKKTDIANVIHENTSRRYRHAVRSVPGQILIQLGDSFNKVKNADYPEEEVFTERHLDYKEDGFAGFSDFLIVGEEFSDAGGPAFAIAIHLTFFDEKDDDIMKIRHFVSDSKETSKDPQGKCAEAIAKMIPVIGQEPQSPNFDTKGCEEYRNLRRSGRFPGLGYLKKLSMLHHMEILNHFLEDNH